MKSSERKKRSEIRIIDPEKELLDSLIGLAKKEKRSIGKQAEVILELYFKKNYESNQQSRTGDAPFWKQA